MAVGFSAYRVQFKQQRASSWWQFARNSNQDAYGAMLGYWSARHRQLVRLGDCDEHGVYTDQRALLLARVDHSEDQRMLAGLFLRGEAGAVKEIRNFDDPEADPVYKTKLNEGVLTPLYVRMHLEDGRNFGIALLQTLGTEGIKGYIEGDMRRFFRDQNLTVKLSQLLDRQVLEAFAKQGALQNVVLINSGKTERSRAAMQQNTVAGSPLGQTGDKLEMRVTRRGGFGKEYIQQIWNILTATASQGTPLKTNRIAKVKGMEEIDDLKVEIAHRGRKQTFSLLNPDDSPFRIDITDEVKFGEEGLPTWESLHAAADEAWKSVAAVINGGE